MFSFEFSAKTEFRSGGERRGEQWQVPARGVLSRERLDAHDVQPHVQRDGIQAVLVEGEGRSVRVEKCLSNPQQE